MDLILELVFFMFILSVLAQLPWWFWLVLITTLVIIGVRKN